MKVLTSSEHQAQLETFVDFFVNEFKAEVWYLEEAARGNIPGREEASMTTLFNVVCGLVSLLPVPGVALGFIATAKVFKAVKSVVDDAGSEITAALGDYGSSVGTAVLENFRDIQDTADDMAMLRGSSGDGVVEGGKPIDIESLSVLSRWLGYRLAMRYEHLLVERISLQPEAAIIGLARHAARRSLAYMAQNGGIAGSPQERLDKLLFGVMTSQSLSWYQRPLKLFARKERITGRDTYSKERLYAENAFVNGLWVSETASTFKHAGTEWVHKGKPDQQAKYGFAVGHITSPELSLHSTDDGQLHEWLGRRQCLPVSISDIRAYCQHEAVTTARESGKTADLSFHRFLARRADGFSEQGQAVFQGDISELDLRACDFSGVNFSGTTLTGDLSHSCFDRALLYGITGVGLKSEAGSRVSFVNAELCFSILSKADFQGLVDMSQANLSCSNLASTKFGRLLHAGAVWHKAMLVGVGYDGLAEEQRAQMVALEEKYAQQSAEFNSLNDKVVALEAQIKPLLDSLATDVPPAAGAGGPARPESEGKSRQREHLEALLLAQEKRLQFEAYCRSKLAQLSSASERHESQISLLESNLKRVQEAQAKADAELQSQIDALAERVEHVERKQEQLVHRTSAIALDVKDNAAQLSELRGLVDELSKLPFSSDFPVEVREAYLEKSAIGKLLDEYVTQLSQREQDLHFYVRPDVVERMLGNKTPGEHVLAIEQGESADNTTSLMDEVNAYLESRDEVMLLLGEPGAGKSLFAWYSTQSRLAAYKQVLQGAEPAETPWLPVVIELKHYRLSQLEDLLPTILKKTCRLHEDELKAIQNDNKPAHRLLVILDGFDELKQEADGDVSLKKVFKDIYTTCGAPGWRVGQIKLAVTCRVRELPDRYLEQQYFGFGERKAYRRRILLPFSQSKISDYLSERAREASGSELELLPVADYQAVLQSSAAVKEMVRNPFILRLFVEALPGIIKSGVKIDQIKRYDIYQGFVRQWFEREVLKLDERWQRELDVGSLGVRAVAERFEVFATTLANEMYRHNSLVVDLNAVDRKEDAFKVWAGFERQLLNQIKHQAEAMLRARYQALGAFELDELEDQGIVDEAAYVSKYLVEEKRRQRSHDKTGLAAFRRTSPLRQVGDCYSFIHKSFYEYFIARGVIQIASSKRPLETRVKEGLGYLSAVESQESRRLWQEPEALDFVCEYWPKALAEEKQRMKETWFAVIEATKRHPEHGVAGANAGTLLNWVGVSFTSKKWRNIHMPVADLRRAYLEGSDLRGANLAGAWLGKIQAKKVDLRGADLTGVKFCEQPAVRLVDSCKAIAYHPSRPIVAAAFGKEVRQYHFGENCWVCEVLRGHSDNVTSISYSEDGRWLASGSGDKTIRQWDAENGKPRGEVLLGHTDYVTSVTYSPDGQWLASASWDETIRQWNAESGEPRGETLRGHESEVTCLSYSPNGCWLVSGSVDKTIRQWDAKSGEPRGKELLGHTGSVTCVKYSGDGRRLASGSWDETVRQWDAESGEPRGEVLRGHDRGVNSISYSADGCWLASGSDDCTIRQWDAESGEPRGEVLRGHAGPVTSICYGGNGRWLASGSRDMTIRQWDVESGEPRGAPLDGHTRGVSSISYSADGSWLASGSWDETIRQWDAESGEPRGNALHGHSHKVTSISYSEDGNWLASGSEDCTIRQWDAGRGDPRGMVLRGHTGCVSSISYSSDGRWLASGSEDRTILQWDAGSGELRGKPMRGHSYGISSISYSGDGRWLVSGCLGKTILQWDAGSGKLCDSSPQNYAGDETSAGHIVDQHMRMSESKDKVIHQWRMANGKLGSQVLLHRTSYVTCICLSRDQRRLASGNDDGTVHVWWREIDTMDGRRTEAGKEAEGWRLAWGSKSSLMQLSARGMALDGAIGLEAHQLELLRQHGYEGKVNIATGFIEDTCLDDGPSDPESELPEGTFSGGVEESKACCEVSADDASSPVGVFEAVERKVQGSPSQSPLPAHPPVQQMRQSGFFAKSNRAAKVAPSDAPTANAYSEPPVAPPSKGCGKCEIQ